MTGKAVSKGSRKKRRHSKYALKVLLALTIFQALKVLQAFTVLQALHW
jgi:hypothetical protein